MCGGLGVEGIGEGSSDLLPLACCRRSRGTGGVRTGEVEEVGVKTAGGGDCFERETGSVVQVFLPQTSVTIGSLTVGPTSWSNHRAPEPWELRALLRFAIGDSTDLSFLCTYKLTHF
jgi:hypothetical protein